VPSAGEATELSEPTAAPGVVEGGIAGWPDVDVSRSSRRRRNVGVLRRVARTVTGLWFFALLLVLWWVLSADSTSPYFPPLQRILERLDQLWIEGDARRHLTPSLKNFGYGYGIAAVLGITVGALLWSVQRLRGATSPILYFLYVMPAPALLPAAISLFGIGISMKVSIIAFAAVWPTLLNTLDGMLGVEPVKMDTARALGMSRRRTLLSVVLPAASPQIVAGLRNSLQVAVILMVVSEMVASTSGIGYFILVSQQSFAITDMWTGIIVLALLGSALNLLFVAVERRVLAWHYGARATEEKG
jgi:sulfonate transport system permease protein